MNDQHLRLLEQGVTAWNEWRLQNPSEVPDLTGADLSTKNLIGVHFRNARLNGMLLRRACLRGANLSAADLVGADLMDADLKLAILRGANARDADLTEADFSGADLSAANLQGADFWSANLSNSDLAGANLKEANLWASNLSEANLSNADLSNANLTNAALIETNMHGAVLSGCHIYGASVWNVDFTNAVQFDLVITAKSEPRIITDGVHLAQFIYTLLKSPEIHAVIDSIALKTVLIVGQFTNDQQVDVIRTALRKRSYLPIQLDPGVLESPEFGPNLRYLAPRFVIADLTLPQVILQSINSTVVRFPDSASQIDQTIAEAEAKVPESRHDGPTT